MFIVTHLDLLLCFRHDRRDWRQVPRRLYQSTRQPCWDFRIRDAQWRFVSTGEAVDQSELYSLDAMSLRWLFSEHQVSVLIEQCQLWIKKWESCAWVMEINLCYQQTNRWKKKKLQMWINHFGRKEKLIKRDDQSVSLLLVIPNHSSSLCIPKSLRKAHFYERTIASASLNRFDHSN